jgi:hypothetical protein
MGLGFGFNFLIRGVISILILFLKNFMLNQFWFLINNPPFPRTFDSNFNIQNIKMDNVKNKIKIQILFQGFKKNVKYVVLVI